MSHVKKIPDGYYSLTPYLNLKDTSKAIDFYKKAFDAKEQMRIPISTSMLNSLS